MNTLLVPFAVLASIVVYLLPMGVALERGHPKATGIALLNILLGWTFLGWVAALVWAVNEPFPSEPKIG